MDFFDQALAHGGQLLIGLALTAAGNFLRVLGHQVFHSVGQCTGFDVVRHPIGLQHIGHLGGLGCGDGYQVKVTGKRRGGGIAVRRHFHKLQAAGHVARGAAAVVTIHGGINRDDRRKVQEAFRNDPDVLVLLATDAAGEGVNLQNANLMVNYDLPWNPNRMEQRFGRIHRIGQREVCHLWNLVAAQTREGEVFNCLLEKLAVEREALGGRVFNVLGEAFDNISLKDLLIDAIRYGEKPETRARMEQVIGQALDTQHLKDLMARNALVENHMSLDDLYAIREEMDKAEARKLQPHFISAFFREAFRVVGGELRDREAGRYEVRHVPADVMERDRVIGHTRTPVLKKYERICFDREHRTIYGKPTAELVHPGHPLMAAVTDLVLSSHRSLLKRGAILVDPHDDSTQPRVLFMLDHSVRETAAPSLFAAQRVADAQQQVIERVAVLGEHDDFAAAAIGGAHLGLVLQQARKLFPLAVTARLHDGCGGTFQLPQDQDFGLQLRNGLGSSGLVHHQRVEQVRQADAISLQSQLESSGFSVESPCLACHGQRQAMLVVAEDGLLIKLALGIAVGHKPGAGAYLFDVDNLDDFIWDQPGDLRVLSDFFEFEHARLSALNGGYIRH